MPVFLTCDGCGASISPDALRRGLALEHQGTHYCERCKGPILAFIRNTAPGPSAPQPPKASPLGDLEGEDLDDELEKLANKHRPAVSPKPPPRASTPAGPPVPGVKSPTAPPGKPAPGPLRKTAGGFAPVSGAKLPAPGPIPPAAERQHARPGPPSPPRRPAPSFPGMRVVKPAPLPDPEAEAPSPRRRARKLVLIMGAGTGVLVLLTALLWMFSGPSGEAPAPAPALVPD